MKKNRVQSVVSAECLLLFWNKEITVCDKMYFDSIPREKTINDNSYILPIRKPLLHVLKQILFLFGNGFVMQAYAYSEAAGNNTDIERFLY